MKWQKKWTMNDRKWKMKKKQQMKRRPFPKSLYWHLPAIHKTTRRGATACFFNFLTSHWLFLLFKNQTKYFIICWCFSYWVTSEGQVRTSSDRALKNKVDTWKHTFKTDNTFPFPFTCFISDWISDTFHNILWNNFYVEGHSYSKKPDRNLFRKDFTLGETVQQLTLKCMGNKKETDRWIDGCTLSNNISIPGRL